MTLANVGAGYDFGFMLDRRAPLLLGLVSFLITFAGTRLYTRLARTRGWGSGSVGGVHLHHMVIGIIMILVSVFVPVAGVVGAARFAKPRSLWSKHVYAKRRPEKLERARARFEASQSRYRRFHQRLDDLIGGAPTFTPMSMLDAIGGRLSVRMPGRPLGRRSSLCAEEPLDGRRDVAAGERLGPPAVAGLDRADDGLVLVCVPVERGGIPGLPVEDRFGKARMPQRLGQADEVVIARRTG
jgi:hypothetical protein